MFAREQKYVFLYLSSYITQATLNLTHSYQINFALLISTVLGFGLPIYLIRYGRRLKASPERLPQEREMFTINEDAEQQEDGFHFDIAQRLDDPAVHVSSMALAL